MTTYRSFKVSLLHLLLNCPILPEDGHPTLSVSFSTWPPTSDWVLKTIMPR